MTYDSTLDPISPTFDPRHFGLVEQAPPRAPWPAKHITLVGEQMHGADGTIVDLWPAGHEYGEKGEKGEWIYSGEAHGEAYAAGIPTCLEQGFDRDCVACAVEDGKAIMVVFANTPPPERGGDCDGCKIQRCEIEGNTLTPCTCKPEVEDLIRAHTQVDGVPVSNLLVKRLARQIGRRGSLASTDLTVRMLRTRLTNSYPDAFKEAK